MTDTDRRTKHHLQTTTPSLARNTLGDINTRRLAPPSVGRNRSNSKSSGSRSQGPPPPPVPLPSTSSVPPTHFDPLPQQQDKSQLLGAPGLSSRAKCTHIIVLKPLNGTFETKYLIVPFKPDILKLGRPVVNTNSGGGLGGGSSGSSRRDVSAMVKPDNGNFDSRVLSRSHACLNCDPKTGKICIRDLHSSNGTFVNGTRLEDNEVELKVGDIIDLGTDIDSKFEHKKISAFVEDISVIPLIDSTFVGVPSANVSSASNDGIATRNFGDERGSTGIATTRKDNARNSYSQQVGIPGQGIPMGTAYAYGATGSIGNYGKNSLGDISTNTTIAQRAAFEAAMFGDVNNLNLEDAVLGPETEILSGIFINNSIGTSSNLINIVKSLATEIVLEKQEYAKLKSMENFLINYTINLEYINKVMVDMNDKQLLKLQNSLKQEYSERHDKLMRETTDQLRGMMEESENRRLECEKREEQSVSKIRDLQMEIEDLKTRLEVERYKYTQLLESSQKKQANKGSVIQSETTTEASITAKGTPPGKSTTLKEASGSVNKESSSDTDTAIQGKKDLLEDRNQSQGISFFSNLKKYLGKNTLTITSLSIGVLALIYKYAQRSADNGS